MELVLLINWRNYQMKEKSKEEKIKYDVFSVRLHKGTKKLLMEKKIKSGLSWNRYIYSLLNKKK